MSTRMASGVDGNGNGKVGRSKKISRICFFICTSKLNTDPGDSILAAEVLAAKKRKAVGGISLNVQWLGD